MRELVWADGARHDLRDMFMFVAQRNAAAADRLEHVIIEGAERVAAMPFAYRIGREPDTREAIVHPNYIIVFRVDDEQVRILRVVHARQRYP